MIIVTDRDLTFNPTGIMAKYFRIGPIVYKVDCIHEWGCTFTVELIDDIKNVYIETILKYKNKIYRFDSFGFAAFNNQKNIESVEIDKDNDYYSENGVLYEKYFDKIILYYYPIAKKDEEFIINKEIDLIDKNSLLNKNPYLKTIVYKNKKLKLLNNKLVLC